MRNKGLFLVLSTAIISGFSVFINKYGVAVGNPYIFAFLKNTVVAIALTSLFFFLKDFKILRRLKIKQWSLLALIGLIGGSIPFLLFFKGLSLTSAAQGSFIQKTMFIYVAILALIFLKEKLSRNFLIGALLLLLGNVLVLKNLKFSFGYGDLLILVATLFWAVENIISKRALKDLDGKTVAWGRMFFGSVFIIGYLGINGQIGAIGAINLTQAGWILITAALLLGYTLTWYKGLKLIPASVATAVLMIGSPVTTLLTAISTEKINPNETISSLLIVTGLIAILFSQKIGFLYRKLLVPNY